MSYGCHLPVLCYDAGTMGDADSSNLFGDLKGRLNQIKDFFDEGLQLETGPDARLPDISNYLPPEIPENLRRKVDSLQAHIRHVEATAKAGYRSDFDESKKYRVDYKKELNQAQFKAATKINGPVLVIAGAGSGKTRAIVYRVSFLLENNVQPQRILLLTFTRKAAQEMLERVARLTRNQASGKVTGGTFHSFASLILRRFAKRIGLEPNFTIIDASDSADAINFVRGQLGIKKTKKSLFPNKTQLQSIISAARNKNKSIGKILADEHPRLVEYEVSIQKIAAGYAAYKRQANVFDYDDLLDVLYDKLSRTKEFRQEVQGLFDYILVDEYQDTNIIQSRLLKLLADERRNIFVVGDDAQSIYAFRGANFENILRFPREFPGCTVILLEDNYRSTQPILDFSDAVINQSFLGYQKQLKAQKKSGFKPQALKFYDEAEEAKFIADSVESQYQGGLKLRNMAVLYRSAYHSNILQIELLKRGIPFVTFGGIRFIERKHVKDVLAYLRVSLNAYDSIAWSRLLTMLSGLGEIGAGKIIGQLHSRSFKIADYAGKPYGSELLDLLETLSAARKTDVPKTKLDVIFRHYFPYLEATEEDADVRKLDLASLQTLAENYRSLESFVNDFSLDPPSQAFQDKEIVMNEKVDDWLTLSTVHSAKGLEWHSVFIIHALDGLFPSHRSVYTTSGLDEERRLFYVAATRAKEKLFITMPSYSAAYDAYFTLPSRFLVEADDTGPVVEFRAANAKSLQEDKPGDVREPHYVLELTEGDGVKHQVFGEGTVLGVEGDTATIYFKKRGSKRINLSFAPLEKI